MLCTQVINGLASALGVLSLEPGRDLDIVAVSFDPRDTPATAVVEEGGVPASGTAARAPPPAWHFLTADQPAIAQLTRRRAFATPGTRRRSSSHIRAASSC